LDWEKFVKFDSRYLRPSEVDHLVADASKAKVDLGWKPTVGPEQLAKIMVEHDAASIAGYVPDQPVGQVWAEAVG
jgi:GDPmannose 4,6-dehydratase